MAFALIKGRQRPPPSPSKENKMFRSFLRDETGLELSEYAVAAALIALAVVGIFTTLGGNISTVINNLASRIQ
jgi:pilus assembly protein Flp/PilA